jgi:hypothetical protein
MTKQKIGKNSNDTLLGVRYSVRFDVAEENAAALMFRVNLKNCG